MGLKGALRGMIAMWYASWLSRESRDDGWRWVQDGGVERKKWSRTNCTESDKPTSLCWVLIPTLRNYNMLDEPVVQISKLSAVFRIHSTWFDITGASAREVHAKSRVILANSVLIPCRITSRFRISNFQSKRRCIHRDRNDLLKIGKIRHFFRPRPIFRN